MKSIQSIRDLFCFKKVRLLRKVIVYRKIRVKPKIKVSLKFILFYLIHKGDKRNFNLVSLRKWDTPKNFYFYCIENQPFYFGGWIINVLFPIKSCFRSGLKS
jgi:hypothetical protein